MHVFKTADLQCIWLTWIICASNCMPMCLRVSVCLHVWSPFTQPSGQSLKRLGNTRPIVPGVRVSWCPGAQVAGVSCQALCLSGSVMSAATIKAIFHFWCQAFYFMLDSPWQNLMSSLPFASKLCTLLTFISNQCPNMWLNKWIKFSVSVTTAVQVARHRIIAGCSSAL